MVALMLPQLMAAQGTSAREKGQAVIDQALAAVGGSRFLAMQDRVEAGRAYSFYRERLAGLSRARIYTRYLTRPEPVQPGFVGVRERQAFGKDEDTAVIFTETEGYEITFRGARPIAEALQARFRDSATRNIFYILRQRLGEPGLVFEYRGSDVLENQPVDVVEIADSEGRVQTVYFHRSTHLPVRQYYVRRDPATRERIEEVTVFDKYRDVGGMLWPFNVLRERNGEKIFEMFAESVQVNRNLTDELFTLPARMKLLKPAP